MNTGEHLWWIPVAETPRHVSEHPALAGIELGNTGNGDWATMMVLPDMLVYAATGGDGIPYLYAVDKVSGEQVGRLEVPLASRYGMMSYVHQGRQYIVLQTGSSLTAMALPN
jgi:quinoprotein glucose dehydrogenase